MNVLEKVLSETLRKYQDYRQCGQPIPAWLRKQVDGIYLMETDPARGEHMLVEGMQDELDALGKAKLGA